MLHVGLAPHSVAARHEYKILHIMWRYPSFHGYRCPIRHECPLNSDSLMSWVTFLQESLVFTDTITTRKRAQHGCLSACKHIIGPFAGFFSGPHTKSLTPPPRYVRSQSWDNQCFAFFVFSPHLSPFIRSSHSLAPFAIPSAQHAWSKWHKGARRSIILQERSGRL